MTGNVNIYICSEANDSGQARGEQKLRAKTQTCIDASSELRSNSRCVSGSSASLRKLASNGMREKRKKVQPSNSIQNKRERNDETWRESRTTETSDSNEDGCRTDVKLSDQEERKDQTISSARDIRSRGGDNTSRPNRANLCRDSSSNSVVPSSHEAPSSWIAIYSSEARCGLDTDLPLSSVRKNDGVCGTTDSEYTRMCDAIDGGGQLLKSVYTNCVACFADDSEYRDTKLRDLMPNCKGTWEKRMGYKVPGRSVECQAQQRVARQWSVCSCIAEEEEEEEEGDDDYCRKVDGMSYRTNVEKVLPENSQCSTRVICSDSARDATVTSLDNAGDRFEEASICKSVFRVSECPGATIARGATLENAQEPLKVTRVSKKLVTEELPRDITVCERIFAGPRGPPKEETVCETAGLRDKSDSKAPKEVPQETICKIPGSNFADFVDDAERVSTNVAKLAKEKMDSTDLSDRKENVVNAKGATTKSDDRRNNVDPNLHLDRQQPAKHRGESVSYRRFNDSSVSIAAIRDLSKDQDSTESFLHTVELQGRPNYSSSSNAKETPKNLVNRETSVRMRLSPVPRPIGRRFRSGAASKDPVERDFTSETESPKRQSKEKEEDEKVGSLEGDRWKGTLLHRSLEKLLDIIRRRKAIRRIKSGKETKENRNDSAKKRKHEEEDDAKPSGTSGEVVEINDYEKVNRRGRDVGEGVYRPMRLTLANKHETAGYIVASVEKQEPMSLATDATTLSKGDEKSNISSTNRRASLKPKLLRIIATKRSHLRPSIETTDGPKVRETKVVGDEIPTSECVDRGEIPLEPISAKVTEDTAAVESIVRDVSAALVQDASKDVVDIPPKDMAVDENGVSVCVADETTGVRCRWRRRKKAEEESRKSPIPCKCGRHLEPNSGLRLVTECSDPLEDCFFRRHKQSQAKETEYIRAPPTRYPKSRSKIDKLIFRSVSPSSESPRVCTNCRGTREACWYRQAVTRFHCCRYGEECGCGTYECGCRYSPDVRRCDEASASRVNRCRRRDKRCRGTERVRSCEKPMICLYCDNPRDECTCRAPIGKCSRCGLSSDVCDCQDDRGRARERVVGSANKGGSIRVTSWKPRREIIRYFARNDFAGTGATKERRCYEKKRSTRRRPDEGLPYQRLNVFSDVMNELQKKMSESVRCTRCRRNPCCCGGGSQVNPNEGKERRRVEDYVRYAVTAREPTFPRR